MAGVLFIVTIPTKEHEYMLSNQESDDTDQGEYVSTESLTERKSRNRRIAEKERQNIEAVNKFFKKSENYMEGVLRKIIHDMKIRNVSWQKVNESNSYKISFSLEKGARCDATIHLLSTNGIGQGKGSSCVIIPCSVYKDKSHLVNMDNETSPDEDSSWNKHVGNIRARLNVEKLVHAVRSDAKLSFDFIILLIVASIVASFGLVENSTLILTASMLISPLMGPILASTFGTIIKDRRLQTWGFKNEIIGIFLCIVVGFFFGIILCVLDFIFGIPIGLTTEMLSRCTWKSVIVGICIALPSGAAQSIALLRENFGSLVGVAISASLLPPAVNTGLLWSYSCVSAVSKCFDTGPFASFALSSPSYSNDPALELLVLGSLSLFLTITNVICVYLMGYIFLCIKIEVAPVSTEEERRFWKHDIPITRDYNKTLNTEDGKRLREQMGWNYAYSGNFNGVGAELFNQQLNPYVNTWSPLMHKYQVKRDQRKSIVDFYGNLPKADHSRHRSDVPKTFNAMETPPSTSSQMPGTSYDANMPSTSSQLPNTPRSDAQRHATFVDIESSSDERAPRKFIVTPAKDVSGSTLDDTDI